ncbi:MAG: L,D-transpeptidase [Pseudolabrys sp.]|nr:L,D-transpeptidase [Pseudolabrys sp.]
MRRVYCAAILVLAAAGQAHAQQQMMLVQSPYASPRMVVVAPQPAQERLDLGGGFVEFLFGERGNRGPQMAPAAPPPDQRPIYANTSPIDPQYYDPATVDPEYLKQQVDFPTTAEPGSIVIDTPKRFLFLVEGNGKALRYGIGVGRPGFTWAGSHAVSAKREWPDWHPPKEMLERQPWLPHFMAGGPNNPLGARAIYLGSTLYRIHGSNEPWTIGTMVSSGCIRMRNEDVIDLYGRVKVGAKVTVI